MKGPLGGQRMRRVSVANALAVRRMQKRVRANVDSGKVAVPGDCDADIRIELSFAEHAEFAVVRLVEQPAA